MLSNKMRDKIRELIISSEGITGDTIDSAKRFIRLTKDGRVVFIVPLDKIPVDLRVFLYMAGKRLAKEAGLTKSDVETPQNISQAVGADVFRIKMILEHFAKQNIVSVAEEGYKINDVFSEILARIEEYYKSA